MALIQDFTLTNYLADGETEPVYFGIYWPDSDQLQLPGAVQEVYGKTRHVPGSDINHTFFGGKGPLRWQYSIWLASKDDHDRLQDVKQTYGALMMPKNIADLPGTDVEREGTIYRVLENVALIDVSDVAIQMDGAEGGVECVTYWQRNSRSGE